MSHTAQTRSSPHRISIRDATLWEVIRSAISEYCEVGEILVRPAGLDTTMELRHFWKALARGSTQGYLRDFPLPSQFDYLENAIYRHFNINNWLLSDSSPVYERWFWLFAGPTGTGSPLHLDVMNTPSWNLLISGEKEWDFLPPSMALARGMLPPSYARNFDVDGAEVRVVQEAGDIVWIPAGWAHQVLNRQISVAITGNYIDEFSYPKIEHYLKAANLREALDRLHTLHSSSVRHASK